MADWKKTDYGTPDTWAEQQQKKRNEQMDKEGASSLFWQWMFGLALLAISVGCIGYVILSLVG